MKKFLVCAAVFVALGVTSAAAADLPVKAPVYKAPVAVAPSWTGCYLGKNFGGVRHAVLAQPERRGATAGEGTQTVMSVGQAQTRCVYRKPKPGHSGDEALQESGVNL